MVHVTKLLHRLQCLLEQSIQSHNHKGMEENPKMFEEDFACVYCSLFARILKGFK